MTKSVEHDKIVELISNNLPELTLGLCSKETGVAYSCKTNEKITLPEGVYTIMYSQKTERYAGDYLPGNGEPLETPQLSKKPQIKMKESEITISRELTKVSLNAEFDCFAIVANKVETQKVVLAQWVGSIYPKLTDVNCQFLSNENICISFLAKKPGTYTFNVIPSDETQYMPKEYAIHSYDLQNGKYYWLHPYSVTNTSTSIHVEYPDWEEGRL